MRQIRRLFLPIFLLTLFTAYQVSITMFTHIHYINGIMIVHSHPFSDKHHTHTKSAVVVINRLSIFQSPGVNAYENLSVERPILCKLESEVINRLIPSVHLRYIHLRAPPC